MTQPEEQAKLPEVGQSKVEHAKKDSRLLRGTLAEALQDGRPDLDHDNVQVLKFHGSYQQQDRDACKAQGGMPKEKKFWFMVRVKIPGGVLSADQYLSLDRLADEVVYNQSLRVTTRQNCQLHGVLKGDLRSTIHRVNEMMLTTFCGCGDVERNIVAPAAPLADEGHRAARALAQTLDRAMCPRTRAYAEIWLDGERVDDAGESEPFYGPQYLPRKLKTGIALPDDNSVDVYDQDIGLIAVLEAGRFRGVNIVVGGSMGLTHRNPNTYARLAAPLGFADAEQVVDVVRTIAGIFRDYGDRTNRRHARLKYVVEELGIEWCRDEFHRRAPFRLKPWIDVGPLRHRDYLGLHEQGDGRLFYGVHVENGRIVDTASLAMKSAFREVVKGIRPGVIFTPNQNVIFSDLRRDDVVHVKSILARYGVPRVGDLSTARRYAMACPALPTCGLALTESERVMPTLLDDLEGELSSLGLDGVPLTVRMVGCPNGCSRPYTADLAFVGHRPGHYDIHVGGRLAGDRFVDLYAENVLLDELVKRVRPLLESWSRLRMREEGLGDFYQRVYGSGKSKTILSGAKDNPAEACVLAAASAAPSKGVREAAASASTRKAHER